MARRWMKRGCLGLLMIAVLLVIAGVALVYVQAQRTPTADRSTWRWVARSPLAPDWAISSEAACSYVPEASTDTRSDLHKTWNYRSSTCRAAAR